VAIVTGWIKFCQYPLHSPSLFPLVLGLGVRLGLPLHVAGGGAFGDYARPCFCHFAQAIKKTAALERKAVWLVHSRWSRRFDTLAVFAARDGAGRSSIQLVGLGWDSSAGFLTGAELFTETTF